jgi:hypothetical protein
LPDPRPFGPFSLAIFLSIGVFEGNCFAWIYGIFQFRCLHNDPWALMLIAGAVIFSALASTEVQPWARNDESTEGRELSGSISICWWAFNWVHVHVWKRSIIFINLAWVIAIATLEFARRSESR